MYLSKRLRHTFNVTIHEYRNKIIGDGTFNLLKIMNRLNKII